MRPSIREVRRAIRNTHVDVEGDVYYEALEQSPAGKLNILPLDGVFRCLPPETWDLYLQWSRIDKFDYVSDFYDCDDFAIGMKAELARKFRVNSCVFVLDYSGTHAYCMLGVIQPDGGVRFRIVEPQNDGTVNIGDETTNNEAYALEWGALLV